MGLLKKIVGLGLVAGAGAATQRVVSKVKAARPEGFTRPDGKTDTKAMAEQAAKAAGEVCCEVAQAVKEKAPVFVQKVKDTVRSFGEPPIDVDIEIDPEDENGPNDSSAE